MTVFKVRLQVLPRRGVLDPQGEATRGALHGLGFSVDDVRIGKLIDLALPAATDEDALAAARRMAEELLANPVIEEYTVELLS